MTDQDNHDGKGPEDETMDFASMLDEYDSGISRDLNVGDPVEGRIISIGSSRIYVDTGTKSDGVVEKSELLDENNELPFSTGDPIKLYVVSVNESEIILSKAISGAGMAAMIEDAYRGRTPVEGRVTGVVKGGFTVDIMGKRAFCPVSQMDVIYVETQEDYVNQTFHFLITRYEDNGRNIVVSRRELLAEQIEQERRAFLSTLSQGDVIEGTVTRLMPFGAFVELVPGMEGMIHVSELSWSRVEKPEEVVKKGDRVKVKVLAIEPGKEKAVPKIGLSIRQLSSDPWDDLESTVKPGEQMSGKVVRIAPFGAFVEVAHGLEGLVHISEMSHTRRVVKVDDVVKPGDIVQVVVKAVDQDRKRISLSIKDALGDPWVGANVRYAAGSVVKGTLEKRENFGMFISLEPGITGLLPSSVLSASDKAPEYSAAKPGDSIEVTVTAVDEENRRISLAPSGDAGKDDWSSYAGSGSAPMGTMASVLKEALKKEKK